MAEQRKPVQPVRVSYACDKCCGDVLPTGMCLTTYPAQYPHDCQQCGERYTFLSMYPRIEYIDATATPPRSPTRDELREANEQALQEIHDVLWGKK